MKIYWNYLLATLVIFIIEVMIALFIRDNFIRPYVGDVLVVMLIYCFVKAFFNTPVLKTAVFVLLFAFGVELLQYFNIVEKLGLQHSRLARTVIGTSYEWLDLLTYTVGIFIVLVVEKSRRQLGVQKKPSGEG